MMLEMHTLEVQTHEFTSGLVKTWLRQMTFTVLDLSELSDGAMVRSFQEQKMEK